MSRAAENSLSIFVDESGDFGEYQKHAPFYILSFVLHEQEHDITDQLKAFDKKVDGILYGTPLQETGSRIQIHAGPIIRNEPPFDVIAPRARQALLYNLTSLTRNLPIQYVAFTVNRRQYRTPEELNVALRKKVSDFIKANYKYFMDFDVIKIYYDRGQEQITAILRNYLLSVFDGTFTEISQANFRLAQVADLICTLELTYAKGETNSFSKSEERFFSTRHKFMRRWMRKIEKQRFA